MVASRSIPHSLCWPSRCVHTCSGFPRTEQKKTHKVVFATSISISMNPDARSITKTWNMYIYIYTKTSNQMRKSICEKLKHFLLTTMFAPFSISKKGKHTTYSLTIQSFVVVDDRVDFMTNSSVILLLFYEHCFFDSLPQSFCLLLCSSLWISVDFSTVYIYIYFG